MSVCLGLKITVRLRILKSSKDVSHPGMVKCPFLFLLMVIPSYLQMKLMKFNSHVQSLCFRASRQINSFKRIAKYLNIERRLTVLKSCILSNFSYCPVTWIFCGKKNCAKLEKLQERALRIVFNDGHASYDTLWDNANILPLNVYRVRFLGIEVYKCVNGLNPKYMNDMLVIRQNADRLRDSSRAIQPKFSSVGFGFKSFKYFGARLWNVHVHIYIYIYHSPPPNHCETIR